ncbi:hypothetical protein TrispH2_003116 [Trichoplax sp. H2]|uniref:Uncharacterized protein n=1 Tax=Trichoplax adhaerens TaxID=10228 RepID=B3RNK0_TRIAD|nr:predicted protein [Trichoplax adhaerens]EDV27467.1 predicted protein [Trichoplax adhaerens]RDD44407.1 hypothetical protein TrispH2_003116 [Trichoplax sp. H2]|eukprot:XP_002109301.1 predicted protein [Trichoplax adhaerens]
MKILKEIVILALIANIGCMGVPQNRYGEMSDTDISDPQTNESVIFTNEIVNAIEDYLSRLEKEDTAVYKVRDSVSLRHNSFADKLAKLQVLLELNRITPIFKFAHNQSRKKMQKS